MVREPAPVPPPTAVAPCEFVSLTVVVADRTATSEAAPKPLKPGASSVMFCAAAVTLP